MSSKKAIKSIKTHIEAKNHESALYEATELLKSLDEKDPLAAQALIYRGLALTFAEKKDEAEKSYLHAYRLQPTLPLATIGLKKLYQKDQQWEKLGRFLEVIVQDAYDRDDAEACATNLEELVQLREQHGPEDALHLTLALFLPSSPLVPLLQPLPPPQGTYAPFPSPIYPPKSFLLAPSLPKPLPHILHLLNSLPLLLNLLIRSQSLIYNKVEADVKAGRTRLGAGPEKVVRKNVEGEVLGGDLGMSMVDLLREVGGHPGVDEAVRRDVEVKEFSFWRKLVGSLPPDDGKTPAAKPKAKSNKAGITVDPNAIPTPALFEPAKHAKVTREEAKSRTDGLAKGFVLLNIGGPEAEEGWSWVLEGKDEPTLFYDVDLLHKFAKAFPQAPLTDFIDDYCRWFKLPLPDPEEEEEEAIIAATESGSGEARKTAVKRKPRKGKGGLNARERRKNRRAAGKEGTLNEDVDQEERDELVGSMTKLLDKLPKSIFAHRVVARISIEEGDWANAISFAEKGRNLLKELEAERGTTLPNVKASLDTALGVALVPYYSPKHHPRALRLLNGVLTTNPENGEARFARAQISESAGQWLEARKEFQHLLDAGGNEKEMISAEEELGWCLVNEGKLEEGRDVLEGIVEKRDGRVQEGVRDEEAFVRARAWWRLGQTEWMIGDNESKVHAEEWFMASMRALPTYAPAYTSLGLVYESASPPDHTRALKCFQKAFELDATEADAARRLAMGYADDDEWALVRAIAVRVMEGEGGVEGVAGGDAMNAKARFAPRNGWAWKALGSTEMHYKNYAKAASAYQIALRAEPDDVTLWIQLGESYLRSGRHMASLKALQHALELDPAQWIAHYHIGDIHSQLGSFDLAIESYEKVSDMTDGKEVGVLAAIATGMLDSGRVNAAGGFRERSKRAFRGAMRFAGDVLRFGVGHRPWGWKVIGDAAFELFKQESDGEDYKESAEITRDLLGLLVEDDADRRGHVDGIGHAGNLLQEPVGEYTTLMSSTLAYAYRAHLLKNEPRVINSALYDLACSLHALAGAVREDTEKKQFVRGAMKAIRLGLDRDAGDERFWDAFGVISEGLGDEVAQHAFVVSLELYAKDPISWTNLGYLYLKLDDLELANQCFLKAQIIDPDYAKPWLGQGLVASKHGDEEHAKALFAHSVTLSAGSLLEADLASAVSTFQPYLSPGSSLDTAILHQPAFALRHYIHRRPRDSAAAHLYALICERIGLVEEAVSTLHRATQLLEEEFEATESEEIEKKYIMALVNLGRVRLAATDYAGSKESYDTAWELVSTSEDAESRRMKVQCQVGLGLASYWLGEVDASLEAFQAGLEIAESKGLAGWKEEVSVLLARTLWGLGGEDARDAAKSHLLECLSQDKPPIKVITALAAVAISSNDEDLIDAALSEIQQIPLERLVREDRRGQTTLVRYAHVLTQEVPDHEEPLRILEAGVHAAPGSETARLRLAKGLIQGDKAGEAVDVLSTRDGKESALGMRLRGVAQLLHGEEEGLRTVQKAVRAKPWDDEGWEALAWARKIVGEAEDQ